MMNALRERILRDGEIREGNVLKVDSFLNHQMDVELIGKILSQNGVASDES